MNLICPNCNCYIVSKRAHKKYCSGKQEVKSDRRYEILNGVKYEYPCYVKGHIHSIDCCTPEMWDAASEEAYGTDA